MVAQQRLRVLGSRGGSKPPVAGSGKKQAAVEAISSSGENWKAFAGLATIISSILPAAQAGLGRVGLVLGGRGMVGVWSLRGGSRRRCFGRLRLPVLGSGCCSGCSGWAIRVVLVTPNLKIRGPQALARCCCMPENGLVSAGGGQARQKRDRLQS